MTEPVFLGFVEKSQPDELQSSSLPSKVGGKPAWLELENLPKVDGLLCPECGDVMTFLLQLYSPLEEEREDAFHRTLFVFCCKRQTCHAKAEKGKCFKIFRSQLSQANKYYSPEEGDDSFVPTVPQTILCTICGVLSHQKCGGCRQTAYCSKGHQRLHWTNGRHKEDCPNLAKDPKAPQVAIVPPSALFPEFEIVSEPEEPESKEKRSESPDAEKLAKDAELAKEITEKVSAGSSKTDTLFGDGTNEEELIMKEDKAYTKFEKVVQRNPDQVLRYSFGGQPVWPSLEGQPAEASIPPCPHCGAKRTFEFQIMPQLLYYLEKDRVHGPEHNPADDLDFGTVAIFTCDKSCEAATGGYAEEMAWVVGFSMNENPLMKGPQEEEEDDDEDDE